MVRALEARRKRRVAGSGRRQTRWGQAGQEARAGEKVGYSFEVALDWVLGIRSQLVVGIVIHVG
jgi:hypothetical protein